MSNDFDTSLPPATSFTADDDATLWGWDATPGIVSVWASREGRALVWQRADDRVRCSEERFKPWLFATTLVDLEHLGAGLAPAGTPALVTYQELNGPSDGYRFLLSARPGYSLEQAILRGASRRLGRAITSLHDLDDTYYHVGPCEQYLMQTGRVLFRGMRYADLHRLQFDLETTALDAGQGRIFLIAVRDSRGLQTTLEAPTPDDEARLIADLCALIRQRDPDVIENHNLFGFDLPFLEARAKLLNVPLLLHRAPGPARWERYLDPHGGFGSRRRMRPSIAGRELIDTLDAVWRYDFAARDLPNHRLKVVAQHFGVAAPARVYLTGADVWPTYQTDPELVRHYALDDVSEVNALSERLLGVPFTLAGMAPRRFERLASAGPAMGILEPLMVRAYLHAGAALPPQQQHGEHGLHAGGALHLFATGVAQHVVKADVASLYPSIMRTYNIGSGCDRLGVLLHLVDRLTELRLMHKASARAAPAHSLEADIHHANQAAMKVLINAAYGYLGAGRMALWGDRDAADAITRQGRAVLDKVVTGLRAGGVALIEADTDGVYFAVPPAWTEAQERALVANVAAQLPVGINLECEGRYQAMFSHEVKNYALLRHDGTLIVRGVALRSSRAEPFGEAFLRQALPCTLQGDTVGVRAAFLAMVHALRTHALPFADVAIHVRLSKSFEQYQVTRNGHRELQYEALLATGRTTWTVGERVRVYRAQGGVAALLPAHADDSPAEESASAADLLPYDAEYYVQLLQTSYAARLRKAFAPDDWAQIFRLDAQLGLFDQPVDEIEPLWIRG